MRVKLKELREKQQLKAKTLCELTGIKRAMYSHYETGRYALPPDVAVKIAPILKVNWWELYELEE